MLFPYRVSKMQNKANGGVRNVKREQLRYVERCMVEYIMIHINKNYK